MLRTFAIAAALVALPGAALAQGPPARWRTARHELDPGLRALVLLMTLPGLGLFYGGLVRAKNLLSVLLQIGAVASVASLLWIVVGYSFASAAGRNGCSQRRGDARRPRRRCATGRQSRKRLRDVPADLCGDYSALMIGAWADRSAVLVVVAFCAMWGLLVYAPVAHWVWGGGWLAQAGALDFAGGIVVHTTAGVSALVIALLLGKRQGFPGRRLLPHAPGLTMLGAMLLWVGWFGFQRRLGAGRERGCSLGDHQHACAASTGGARMAGDRAVHVRQADHGRLRHRRDRRPGDDHPVCRLRLARRGDRDRRDRRRALLLCRSSW
jgi:Amt family ammonium transporter